MGYRSTNHYVRIGHTEKMGFPSRKETMRVCTIGGDVKTIDGILYQCQIIERGGNVEEFIAHSLEDVTGTLNNPLMSQQLKKLFANCPTIHRLAGTQIVNYLLGLNNTRWHPEWTTKAKGGCDL